MQPESRERAAVFVDRTLRIERLQFPQQIARLQSLAESVRSEWGSGATLKSLIPSIRSTRQLGTLERMSAQFETTRAGLQHATHLYEGEGKYLGVQLAEQWPKTSPHRRHFSASASSSLRDHGPGGEKWLISREEAARGPDGGRIAHR